MSTVDIDFMSPTGFYNMNQAISSEEFAQVAASSYNPVGIVGEMTVEPHGITQALEASGSSDSLAVVNIAIPPLADKTLAATVRTGWSTPSTTITNEIEFSIEYVWLSSLTDTTKVADGEIFCTCNPVAVANGYQISNFTLPAPGATARVAQLRLNRYGAADSESAVANTLGFILAFTPIKQ